MIFDLPDTDTEQPPVFTTAATCQDWLKSLTALPAPRAQSVLLQQLSLLLRYSLPVNERFTILETLRAPIYQTQENAAKKFIGRPLPLAPPEQAALDSTLALWQSLFVNYLQCVEAPVMAETNAKAPSRKNATIIQRALTVLADSQLDLIQGKRLPDFGYWKKLHQIFYFAEANNLITEPIKDAMRHGSQLATPLAVYAECHLLFIASPYELSARELTWIARWAKRWGGKIKLLTAPPEDILRCAHPLWVDLDSDQPADYSPRPTAQGRWLETTDLRSSLSTRIALLAEGRAPADLQLGSDITQPAAGELLTHLLHRWCQGGSARRHVRQSASGDCQFAVGWEAIHRLFPVRSPSQHSPQDDQTLREERATSALPGNASHRLEIPPTLATEGESPNASGTSSAAIEDWNLLDRSASGLRISRPIKEGVRIAVGTLIAARIAPDETFTLGCVRWTLRQDADSLAVGIQLFPGKTAAITALALSLDQSERTPCRFAYWIEADATTAAPARLVLPMGSFQIGRLIELSTNVPTARARLTRLLAHGSEFECCAFTTENHLAS